MFRTVLPLWVGMLGCTPTLAPEATDAPATDVATLPATEAVPTAPVDDLAGTVWHGRATVDGVERRVEHHFTADRWIEVVNPFGPSTQRIERALDGSASIQGGDLHVEDEAGVAVFTEGPTPLPTRGFTANARVFAPGGAVDEAFCDSGVWGFDYETFLPFARGVGEAPVAEDVVGGVDFDAWVDPGENRFALVDVPGFDRDGGTALDDRYNFVVTYRGTIDHPGGTLQVREADDQVEDGIWVFVGEHAGSGDADDALLAVNGFYWPDGTVAEPSVELPAGPVAIEVIVARCTETIAPVELEYRFGDANWQALRRLEVLPVVATDDFPGAF